MNLLEPSGDTVRTGPAFPTVDHRLAGDMDAAVSAFVAARPRLFRIALHVLDDVDEAEDVVQEAWLRWKRADRSLVVSPAAFLAMTTTRLAINVVQSARRRRERLAGPELPETVDRSVTPETAAERHEAVDAAIRLLLDRLTPAERAAYLLRKAFDYPYPRISELLDLRQSHVRQLVRRAHEHIATDRSQQVNAAVQRRLVRAFLAAAQNGDLADLEGLLAADVVRKTGRGAIGRSRG